MYRICKFPAFYSHFQVISGKMTSLLGYFWSPEDMSHLLPCDCLQLQATALWEVKHTVSASFRPSTVTSR